MVTSGPYTQAEIEDIEAANAWFKDQRKQADEEERIEREEIKRRDNPVPYRLAELYRAFEEIDLDCLRGHQESIGVLNMVWERYPEDQEILGLVRNLIEAETSLIQKMKKEAEHDRQKAAEFERLSRR